MQPRGCGWNPPTAEHYQRAQKGRGLAAVGLLLGTNAAQSANNSALTTLLDQSTLGACTAQAVAQVIFGAMVAAGADRATLAILSRLFAYYMARVEDGNQATDAGSQICTVFDAVCRVGFAKEAVWPYDVTQFATMPPWEAFREGIDQQGQVDINYHRVDAPGIEGAARLLLIKQALTAGYLVTWGTQVSNDYCQGNLGTDPIKPPASSAQIAGGHAQTLVGFDDTVPEPYFLNLNSWGPEFQQAGCAPGFCKIDPTYITWPSSSDFWICRTAPRFSA
jgi:hypothetical protein